MMFNVRPVPLSCSAFLYGLYWEHASGASVCNTHVEVGARSCVHSQGSEDATSPWNALLLGLPCSPSQQLSILVPDSTLVLYAHTTILGFSKCGLGAWNSDLHTDFTSLLPHHGVCVALFSPGCFLSLSGRRESYCFMWSSLCFYKSGAFLTLDLL